MVKVIDFSAHIIPPKVKGLVKVQFRGAAQDLAERQRLMKQNGIAKQVVHMSTGVLASLDPKEAANVCKYANEYIRDELVSKKPDQFVGCGIISIADQTLGLEEIDRVSNMGFKCLSMPTHQGKKGLDHEDVKLLLIRATEKNLPVFIHPTDWSGYSLLDNASMEAIGWPFDTSLIVWRLIVGNTFEKIKNLKIIMHHLGGMLPYFKDRINMRLKVLVGSGKRIEDYIKNIYIDTAIDGGSVASLLTAYSTFGPERILFGSDWPYIDELYSIKENLAAISAMPIPNYEKNKILFQNAEELIGIKA
ncbi:MAG: amidohydrolase family protein [Conexivisphaerales archaeon]